MLNKDNRFIFENYIAKGLVSGVKTEDSEDLPTRSHEIIAAIMPKDININGKKNENEFFNKAFPYVAKIIFDGDERRAQRYMYYDEDFNSDLISTYAYYQKHGFPKLRDQDVERINRKMSINNKEENAEMPASEFNKLKQHINKGPITFKKPSKELPSTHNQIHDLAKQDSREGQKEENAEGDYSNIAHDYAERIVGADVEDPKALAKHYLDNPDDLPEPLKHEVLKQNFEKILKYIDFTVQLDKKRKQEAEYKQKELKSGPVHPDPEIGLSGSKQARYKPHYRLNPADYLPRQ